jgi:hypothetical protein
LLGEVLVWTAVALIAGTAVVLALVVAPVRDVASPSIAAPERPAGREAATLAMTAATAPAVAARDIESPKPAPPPPPQTAPARTEAERPAAAHNPRQAKRVVAHGYRERFRSYDYGRSFAFFPFRNKWR